MKESSSSLLLVDVTMSLLSSSLAFKSSSLEFKEVADLARDAANVVCRSSFNPPFEYCWRILLANFDDPLFGSDFLAKNTCLLESSCF